MVGDDKNIEEKEEQKDAETGHERQHAVSKSKRSAPVKNLKKLAVKKRIEIVKRYTSIIREKFGKYISAVVVFGSFARGDFRSASDIDVLVIVDDTSGRGMPPQIKEDLHKKLQGIGVSIDKKLHIQLHTVTEFWDYIRHGDAIFFNFVREGVPVYDSGFFRPIKKLLLSGSIRPTREAVWKQMDGAGSYIKRVDKYMEWSAERLFRAASWSANGALMALDIPPARPKEIGEAMERHLVKPGILEKHYVDTYNEIFALHKNIEHGDVTEVTPAKIEEYLQKTKEFCKKMSELSEAFLKKGERAKQLKEKLRNTAKIFWLYEGGKKRGYAWVFERAIFIAIYIDQELREVWKAPVSERHEVGAFIPAQPPELFKAIETSTFVPVIGDSLIQIILNALDKKHRKGIIKVGVEFPKRAIVDMSSRFIKGERK